MTNKEKLLSLMIMYEDTDFDLITDIKLTKDGRILFWTAKTVTQVPKHLLEQFGKEVKYK